MNLKNDPLDIWNDICYLRYENRTCTRKEFNEYYRKRKEETKEKVRKNVKIKSLEWEDVNKPNYLDQLIIKYKDTGDEKYFNDAWNYYLKKIIKQFTYNEVIKGTTKKMKDIFMYNQHDYKDLEDELYIVLVKCINEWKPYRKQGNRATFKTYFYNAVRNYTGGIKTKMKSNIYQNISLKNIDFSNEEEIRMLVKTYPTMDLHYHTDLTVDKIVFDDYLEEFIDNYLDEELSNLLGHLITDCYRVEEIAILMKKNKRTIYRRIKKLYELWIEYENKMAKKEVM
ncbi:MAG: hypothetical protein ACOC2W_00845 [bacterium]